jgi:hypothetical protein
MKNQIKSLPYLNDFIPSKSAYSTIQDQLIYQFHLFAPPRTIIYKKFAKKLANYFLNGYTFIAIEKSLLNKQVIIKI